jgi:hypothetical protein
VESAKLVVMKRIAFLVSVRGVCEVDFVFKVVTRWVDYPLLFFCLPLLLNPRKECQAFLENAENVFRDGNMIGMIKVLCHPLCQPQRCASSELV